MRDINAISLESHLTHLPLFTGVADRDIKRIAGAAKLIQVPKGDILFHAGDACTGFHILVFGQIKLAFTSSQGAEKVVEIVRQGHSFGEAIMFLDRTYIVFAQALQDSLLIHIPKAAILDELEHDYEFAKKMLAGLAKRTHDLMKDLEAYSTQSAKQRIIGYLMSEAPQAEIVSDVLEFEFTVGKGVVASRLNITQEHFSRVLHDLSDGGLIEVRGKTILVPSVSKLLKSQDTP